MPPRSPFRLRHENPSVTSVNETRSLLEVNFSQKGAVDEFCGRYCVEEMEHAIRFDKLAAIEFMERIVAFQEVKDDWGHLTFAAVESCSQVRDILLRDIERFARLLDPDYLECMICVAIREDVTARNTFIWQIDRFEPLMRQDAFEEALYLSAFEPGNARRILEMSDRFKHLSVYKRLMMRLNGYLEQLKEGVVL
jgi:hypothetical protein